MWQEAAMRHGKGSLAAGRVTGALLMAMAAAAGCGGDSTQSAQPPGAAAPPASPALPSAVAQAKEAGSAVNPAIVAADNGFGVRLFQTLNSSASGNVAISPLSV